MTMPDYANYELHDNDTIYHNDLGDYYTPGYFIKLICELPLKLNSVVIILCLVSFFGVIGNGLLLMVIFCNKRLRNAPNMLIINVAFADILYIASNAPFYILHELGRPCWGLGFAACQLRHYIPQVAQGGCIFSLTALSRERYAAIVKGFESRITRSTRRIVITASMAWIFGLVIGIPVLFLTSTTLGGINCLYMPLRTKASEAYSMFLFVTVYLIPLIFISVHYCHIAKSLCKSTRTTIARSSSGGGEQMKGRRRLAQVVLVITLFFGVFWFPHYVYLIWSFFTRHGHLIEANAWSVRVFRYIDYYMALANSCLNPWIVFIMSSVHRNTLCRFRSRLCKYRRPFDSSPSRRSSGNRMTKQTDTDTRNQRSSASNPRHIIVTKI